MIRRHADYSIFAPIYDVLSNLYSAGGIRRAKKLAVECLRPGQKVLFAGVGTGEDACLAAKKGCYVTALDLSQRMVERCNDRLKQYAGEDWTQRVRFVCADIRHAPIERDFDAVVSCFFLNVFSEADMKSMFRTLASFTHKDGAVVIADFAPPPQGFILLRWLRETYFLLPMSLFKLTVGGGGHAIYDYPRLLADEPYDWSTYPSGLFQVWHAAAVAKQLTKGS